LEPNEVYSLHDLFHGLMLPSGNDASLAIAVWGGKKLMEKK
jgi:D-alanyl-D-alanine carboxypeptidase